MYHYFQMRKNKGCSSLFSYLDRYLIRCLSIVFVCVCVVGCKSVSVQDDLDQKQANQIVSVLHAHGIAASASRGRGGRSKYSVSVNSRQYSEAVSILTSKGLPGDPHVSFQELVAQRGLLPNSREIEALRLDYALAVQLEETIQNFPQVAVSKVVVRSHSIGPEQEPSVSVVLQLVPGAKLDPAEVTNVVENAAPEVDSEKVSISMQAAMDSTPIKVEEGVVNVDGNVIRVPLVPFLVGWRVPKDDYIDLALALVVFLIAMAFLGIVCGYWYATYKYSREFSIREIPDRTPRQIHIEEGPQRELPEA